MKHKFLFALALTSVLSFGAVSLASCGNEEIQDTTRYKVNYTANDAIYKVEGLKSDGYLEGEKVENKLIDFSMSSAFFTSDEGAWKLHLGQGLGEYLDNFLPSTIIEEDGSSIDEETFEMVIEENKMTIDYDYSFGLWHINLVVDKFENAANPYPNFELVEFSDPTSWAELDFYNDLVSLLGSEERVNELPFIYPDLGYSNAIIIPDFDIGTLIGEFSSEEVASDVQFDYTMDLIMAGFMMNMEDANVYEKEYPEYTLQVEPKVDGADFTLYLNLVRP